jgi:two-component system, NtrC family, response regulator AtoC
VNAAQSPSPETAADLADDESLASSRSATCIVIRDRRQRRLLDVRDHPEVIIGRSRHATFVVDDERISRHHLRITYRDGVIYAEDLGSRNGSTRNGTRIEGRVALQPGDQVVAGPVSITVSGRAGYEVGILGENELWQRLSAEVERAVRYKRSLAVVGVTLRGQPNARREAALRVESRLRRLDAVGEYASGELLAILPETSLAQADTVAATLAAVAHEVAGIEVAARAAAIPDNGNTVDELVAAIFESDAQPSAAGADQSIVVAEDPATRELFDTARRAARSEATVLLTGETGAGKEVVAAEIHRASARSAGPYVRLNCAAIPETLIESELFGHERGAFTGAERQRIGYVEQAHGGTLLLDEIGELPPLVQAKLLRMLEERKIVRVGGVEEIAVDVRFIAATNRDLEKEIAAGRFREDLFFRLSTLTLRVPPLRERPRDIPLLAVEFARRAARSAGRPAITLTEGFIAGLMRYPWSGNVRELRNVVERAVVLSTSTQLTTAELPERVAVLAPSAHKPGAAPMVAQLEDLERRSLADALAANNGNRTLAARKLGISRRALIYKIKKYGLD